ncbi:PaREP1 family protein [Vulcanisaeta sp. JCM 16159]|uniref:PaREP1 family protein n=1 Tax=Vulcanisaeta sp. JCM 16159 TaxID=1295371 RepID=UPI0006D069F5|nr:PaREP1 family protein [Vulcanisaeta sp. JCM 16159]
MSLTLPPTIMELLRELANGRDVEEFIADLVAERLDTQRRVELYLRLHEDYLRAAEELYNKGDLAQAGEKYWGAVTALLNAIDESRGWEHYSHRDYDVIINRLFRETNDGELLLYFGAAERLHVNFYHNFMTKDLLK